MSFSPPKPPTCRTLMGCLGKLCRPALKQGVAQSGADRYVKRYGSVGFALSLIGYYLLGLDSLRELQARLTGDSRLQRLVGWGGISVSQLLKLPHARPSELWQPLVAHLLQRVPRKHRSGKLRILDTSFFTMGMKLMQRHHPHKKMTHPGTAGFKLGAVLDPDNGMPTHIVKSVGQGSDTAHVDALVPPGEPIAGHTFLFDRGFRKYKFFDRLIANGAHFITRATKLVHYEVIRTLPLDPEHPEILCDQIVRLGSHNAKNRMNHLTRRIELQTPKETLVFLASDLKRPPWELCAEYRIRWDIEPFFRWLKSAIGCRRSLGYSGTAAEHTFWAALVVYLIILLLAQREKSRATGRMTLRIKPTIHRVRAVLHEPPSRADLKAFGFL